MYAPWLHGIVGQRTSNRRAVQATLARAAPEYSNRQHPAPARAHAAVGESAPPAAHGQGRSSAKDGDVLEDEQREEDGQQEGEEEGDGDGQEGEEAGHHKEAEDAEGQGEGQEHEAGCQADGEEDEAQGYKEQLQRDGQEGEKHGGLGCVAAGGESGDPAERPVMQEQSDWR
jgi:hypothetical protein